MLNSSNVWRCLAFSDPFHCCSPIHVLQALGCLLYRIAFFKSCFDGESKLQVLNGRYSIPENHKFSAPVIALIRDMLAPSPDARPTVLEVRHITESPSAEYRSSCLLCRLLQAPRDTRDGWLCNPKVLPDELNPSWLALAVRWPL